LGSELGATRGSEKEGLLYGAGLAGEQFGEDAPSAPQVDDDDIIGGVE
jgi:hypothetical protein